MGIRLALALLLLALASSALLAESSISSMSSLSSLTESGFIISKSANTCNNGLIGDCIGEDEEMLMDSESSRRTLAGTRSRISRAAMRRSATPCGRSNRGGRYYGCPPAKANPYRRGCSKLTKCRRNVR